jgi:hypothetical protein
VRHEPRLDLNEGPKLGMPERALNGDLWVEMANSRCGRPVAFSPAIGGVSDEIRPTGSRSSIFENTRLTSRGCSLRYVEPQRTASPATASVAKNQMLQIFRKGGYASVGIFVGSLTL